MKQKIINMFSEIAKITRQKIQCELGDELTPAQNAILVYVNCKNNEGINVNQKDIELEFKIKASSVNSLITNLQKKQYINKMQDRNDKRINYITLTKRAKLLVSRGNTVVNKINNLALCNIPQKDCQNLFNILQKIKNNLLKEQY